jgi:hypothetical protein
MKKFRIPETGVPHYVQGQGNIGPGGTYLAEAALADGDEEVAEVEQPGIALADGDVKKGSKK